MEKAVGGGGFLPRGENTNGGHLENSKLSDSTESEYTHDGQDHYNNDSGYQDDEGVTLGECEGEDMMEGEGEEDDDETEDEIDYQHGGEGVEGGEGDGGQEDDEDGRVDMDQDVDGAQAASASSRRRISNSGRPIRPTADKMQPQDTSVDSAKKPVTKRHKYRPDDDLKNNNLGHANLALRRFFHSRMAENIVGLGGDPQKLLEGWHVQVVMRYGPGLGLLDVVYHSPEQFACKAFTSLISVHIALGLSNATRSVQKMSRQQHLHAASETKEKFFLSQMLAWAEYRADDVVIKDGMLQITVLGANDVDFAADRAQKWSSSKSFRVGHRPQVTKVYKSQDPDRHMAFGNTTIIDWGRVITNPAFHTKSQIYPLGMRVLRIEHDVLKNELVECLCEIDSFPDDTLPRGGLSADEIAARILPLFRITVGWKRRLQNNLGVQVVNRVYEGRSPQQAWGAVMRESLLVEPTDLERRTREIKAIEIIKSSEGELPEELIARTVGGKAATLFAPISSSGEPTSSSSAKSADVSASSSASSAAVATLGTAPVLQQPKHSPRAFLNAYIFTRQGGQGNGNYSWVQKDGQGATSTTQSTISMEPQDAEERTLRKKLLEMRRTQLRLLRQAETNGLREAPEPRLGHVCTESIIDEGLLGLLEGISAQVVKLQKYVFIDAREADAMRKRYQHPFSTMHQKCLNLSLVAKRDQPEKVLKKEKIEKGESGEKPKRIRGENGEKPKRIRNRSKLSAGELGAALDRELDENGKKSKQKKRGRRPLAEVQAEKMAHAIRKRNNPGNTLLTGIGLTTSAGSELPADGIVLKKRGRNQYTGPAPKPLPTMHASDAQNGAPQPQPDLLEMYAPNNFKSKMAMPPDLTGAQMDYLREIERQARLVS